MYTPWRGTVAENVEFKNAEFGRHSLQDLSPIRKDLDRVCVTYLAQLLEQLSSDVRFLQHAQKQTHARAYTVACYVPSR